MATVKIYYDEVLDDALPQICAKCGAPSTTMVSKKFSWTPPWASLIGILAVAMTKRMTVRLPMCDQHRNHWTIRTVVAVAGLLLIVGGVGLSVVLSENQGPGAKNDVGGLICVAGMVFGAVWLLALIVLNFTAIRTGEITDNHIVLVGVSDGFKDALEDEREAEEREREDRYRERRGRDRRRDEGRRDEPRRDEGRRDDYRRRDD